jgi:hypothetical protein
MKEQMRRGAVSAVRPRGLRPADEIARTAMAPEWQRSAWLLRAVDFASSPADHHSADDENNSGRVRPK